MKDVRTQTLEQLEAYFIAQEEPKFRAKQVWEWIWKKNATNFGMMSNISEKLRDKLTEDFTFLPATVSKSQQSIDGTIKNAVELHDKRIVESVLIPTSKRSTACVSSQVGCSLDCTFCATAQLKRMRNLTAAEIYDQVALINSQSQENFQRPLSNIVFMGMGEPLLNYKEVISAIRKITTEEGMMMSPRRITLSTSGIPKMIKMLADENLKIKLALSLHSAIEEKRNKLMPFSTQFPLTDIADALQYWYDKTKSAITFEYLVWNGINDTDEDIQALVKFCKKVPSKVNLIEYNLVENTNYKKAHQQTLEKYIKALEKHNIVAKVRKSRGEDIDAACGQLANKTT